MFHKETLAELERLKFLGKSRIQKIVPEQKVLLEPLRGKSQRTGRFDFLVLLENGETIGFEVLSRPSQGKMRQKLSYAKEVDGFVFVLPSNSFELYRKNPANGYRLQARRDFFSAEFSIPELSVWLANPKTGTIEQKGQFSQVFNTEK